ncbi:MAG: cobaltochelatase subunit CobN [Planctomycetota bacterium]
MPRALGIALCLVVGLAAVASAQDPPPPARRPRLAFVGLHGGVFPQLEELARGLDLDVCYLPHQRFESEEPLPALDLVFVQHLQRDARAGYLARLRAARAAQPRLRVLTLSGYVAQDLVRDGLAAHDPQVHAYYAEGASRENLRRLLVYVAVRYLGREGQVEPPLRPTSGTIYHPAHEGPFADVQAFVRWDRARHPQGTARPRIPLVTHYTHMALQSAAAVASVTSALEARGAQTVVLVDYGRDYAAALRELKPAVVIHLCHSPDTLELRAQVDAPQLGALFFGRQSIAAWERGEEGLWPSEVAFQVTSQEPLGTIEPQVVCGSPEGGARGEAFAPIPERVARLADRALAWARLRQLPNAAKKLAIVYYDRELGQAELMRGSATGMFLNAPRSLVRLLGRLRREGYALSRLPADEDELIGWMQDHGRQIGAWAPGVLDRLARSGKAALVPAEDYARWLAARVPEAQRRALEERWGPAPGKLLVWRRDDGREFLVIPRIELGNVVLLPQPLRGEAHDPALLHDRRVPPPHHYLATYFWLEEGLGAHAMLHFGTHGSEFLLPGRGVGLSPADWSDRVVGTTPNLNLWVLNNTGEALPVKRRASAVLLDHTTPPLVAAGLADELLNLRGEVEKWRALEPGPLREGFRRSVSEQARAAHLDRDLHLELAAGALLAPEQVARVGDYLDEVAEQATPTRLHVLGEPPAPEQLVPYVVTCLRRRFRDALARALPEDAARTPAALRAKAEEVVDLVLRRGLSDEDALRAAGAREGVARELSEGLALARRLAAGLRAAPREVDAVVEALAGRFVAPGPANSPDRNPAALPAGRNMYVLNPEELPTRPSWELAVQVTDRFLAAQKAARGRYPRKVAFDLSSFASFRDYGVMEAQLLYLLGVRPVWNERDLVVEVEPIPRAELGRPRIDVFVFSKSYYRDMLPSRLRLLDAAIRLAASLDEPDNGVRAGALRVQRELERAGAEPARAELLSRARIFGAPPGEISSAAYYYLAERSGQWDTREELIQTYVEHNRWVYTQGSWGVEAPAAYARQLQGSEVVLRSWSDETTSPLSNKYTWWQAGSLSLAIEHLTGQRPELYLTDLRDPERASTVAAGDAVRRDFRARLLNRKWIEGMMKEGYAGADQVAVHVTNALGWKIMRPESVGDDLWEQVVETYVRDAKRLALREWFEAENPFAYQDLTEVLLETIRKGYWTPDGETQLELAREYAASVARHGEGGGIRGGGNAKLEAFVAKTLSAPGTAELRELLARYQARAAEARAPSASAAPAPEAVAQASATPASAAPDAPAPAPARAAAPEQVQGQVLEPTPTQESRPWRLAALLGAALLLLFAGYARGPGGWGAAP